LPVWNQFVDLIAWSLAYFGDLTGSAGMSIIILTVIVKTILLPLTVKALRSTLAMQELQPKVKELQKKFGKDRQRLSAETMKLYQDNGVNPMSGCLPMLLQMPVFFGLYFAIRRLSSEGVGVWEQGFLWIPDLASADPWKILPFAAAFFQFVQMRMTRPAGQGKPDDPQQRMMYTMMNFMPLMVIVIGWTFASGPVLYWAISALYSVIQQWFITGWGSLKDWVPGLPELPDHRRLGYVDPEVRKAKAAQSKNSGFFGALNKKMEEQMKRIEEERERQEAERGGSRSGGGGKKKAGKGKGGNNRKQDQQDQPEQPVAPRPDLVPRRSRTAKSKGSPQST
jgi:YidC/Oxa1 family membrane protein insertase